MKRATIGMGTIVFGHFQLSAIIVMFMQNEFQECKGYVVSPPSQIGGAPAYFYQQSSPQNLQGQIGRSLSRPGVEEKNSISPYDSDEALSLSYPILYVDRQIPVSEITTVSDRVDPIFTHDKYGVSVVLPKPKQGSQEKPLEYSNLPPPMMNKYQQQPPPVWIGPGTPRMFPNPKYGYPRMPPSLPPFQVVSGPLPPFSSIKKGPKGRFFIPIILADGTLTYMIEPSGGLPPPRPMWSTDPRYNIGLIPPSARHVPPMFRSGPTFPFPPQGFYPPSPRMPGFFNAGSNNEMAYLPPSNSRSPPTWARVKRSYHQKMEYDIMMPPPPPPRPHHHPPSFGVVRPAYYSPMQMHAMAMTPFDMYYAQPPIPIFSQGRRSRRQSSRGGGAGGGFNPPPPQWPMGQFPQGIPPPPGFGGGPGSQISNRQSQGPPQQPPQGYGQVGTHPQQNPSKPAGFGPQVNPFNAQNRQDPQWQRPFGGQAPIDPRFHQGPVNQGKNQQQNPFGSPGQFRPPSRPSPFGNFGGGQGISGNIPYPPTPGPPWPGQGQLRDGSKPTQGPWPGFPHSGGFNSSINEFGGQNANHYQIWKQNFTHPYEQQTSIDNSQKPKNPILHFGGGTLQVYKESESPLQSGRLSGSNETKDDNQPESDSAILQRHLQHAKQILREQRARENKPNTTVSPPPVRRQSRRGSRSLANSFSSEGFDPSDVLIHSDSELSSLSPSSTPGLNPRGSRSPRVSSSPSVRNKRSTSAHESKWQWRGRDPKLSQIFESPESPVNDEFPSNIYFPPEGEEDGESNLNEDMMFSSAEELLEMQLDPLEPE